MKKYATLLLSAGLIFPFNDLLGQTSNDLDTSILESEDPVNTSFITDIFDAEARLDLQFESLHSSYIDIDSFNVQFELRQEKWNLSLTAIETRYDVDFESSIFFPASLSERSESIEAEFGYILGPEWSLDFTARYYEGHTSPQTVWFAEEKDQLFGTFSGYVSPAPRGYSYSMVANYSYTTDHSFRASLGYGRDFLTQDWTVEASAAIPTSDESRFRGNVTFEFEDAWTPWLKSENLFSAANLTDRQIRWSAKSTWYAALGERWTVRASAGYTLENPQFEAHYYNMAIEWNMVGNWYLAADLGYYFDTGEIPDAGEASILAPSLDTIQYGLGLRWVGESAAFKLYMGVYESDYETLEFSITDFYQNRDWNLAQISYSYLF